MKRKILFAIVLSILIFSLKGLIGKPAQAADQAIVMADLDNRTGTIPITVYVVYYHGGTSTSHGPQFGNTKSTTVAAGARASLYSDLDPGNFPYYWVSWSTSCTDPPALAAYTGLWGDSVGPGVAAYQTDPQDVHCTTTNSEPSITSTACATMGWTLIGVGANGANVNHFAIFRGPAGDTNPDDNFITNVGSSARSYDFGPLGSGTYYVRVSAVSPQGQFSAPSYGQFTCSSVVIGAASGLRANPSCSANTGSGTIVNVSFSWGAASAGSTAQYLDYSVYNNNFAGGTFSSNALATSATSFNGSGFATGDLVTGGYYWRVNNLIGGNWYPSVTGHFYTPTCPPTAIWPTAAPTATPQPGQDCTLSGCTGPSYTFPSVSRPNSYWHMWDGGPCSRDVSNTTPGLSASDIFCAGDQIYWEVRPVSSAYNAMRSWSLGSGTITSGGVVNLNWSWEYTMCIHLVGYNCDTSVSASKTQKYHVMADSQATFPSHTFTGLNGSAAYQRDFCAPDCTFGSYISSATFTSGPCNCPTPAPTPTPVPVVITLSAYSNCVDGVNPKVHLTWTSNSGGTGYTVFRDGTNVTAEGLPNPLGGSARSWDSTAAQPVGAHNWMVRSTGGTFDPKDSNTLSVTTATCSPPPADPSNLVVTSSCSAATGLPEITFRWQDNSNIETGYYLDVSNDAFTSPSSTNTSPPYVWGNKSVLRSAAETIAIGGTVQFLWNNAATTNTAGQLDIGDVDKAVAGNQLAPERGVTYYWRVKPYDVSLRGRHVYPGGTDGADSDTIPDGSTTPPGISFTTPNCMFDLHVTNNPAGNTQVYDPGAVVTFKVQVTNEAATAQVAYPGGGNLGAWTQSNVPNISCPTTGVAPSGANTQSIAIPSLAVGASTIITLAGFTAPTVPGSYIAYFYALPTCSPNNDLNWTNNSFELTYAVSAKAWFETTGGDVGARGNIQVSNPTIPAGHMQSTAVLAGNPLGSNVVGQWELNNYSSPLFPSDNSGVYNYFNSRYKSKATLNSCSVAPAAGGGFAFDSASSVAGSGSVSSISWSHTVGAGSNRLLVVGVSIRGTATVTGVTYAGAALTQIGGFTNGGVRVELWRRLAPASGSNNVAVTLSAAATVVGGATSWSGVDQTTPTGAFASSGGFSTSPSVNVASNTGETVVDTVSMPYGSADAAPTPGAGQTQRWNLYGAGDIRGFGSTEAGAPTVNMSWTTKNEAWAIGGVSIKPIASSGISAGNNVYQCTTNATAGGDLSAVTGNWVVFVDGDLNVTSNVTLNNNSTLVFIVRNNITINTSVTRADGVYIAGGTFADYDNGVGKSRNTSPYQLTINGAVYAHTLDLSAFLSNLPACNPACTNSATAADVVNFQPRYLVAISQMIGSPSVSWQEVAP